MVLGKLTYMMERCESICDKVIKLDPSIRFVVAVTDNGRPLASRTRNGLVPMMDEKDSEVVLTEAALITRMHRDFDTKLGKVNHILIEREKIAILIFSLGQDILYVSCDMGSNLSKIAAKIAKKII
jgi:predicted regulator of Ras-like GTPase activity (Roadblock/LC7/MglB family)